MERRKLTKEDIDKVRDIEGFPIGKDEDIIALSDAPYYTACPNPFIADFIKENGTPYDEATDDYHREPFSADVSEGKKDPIYNAHSYHTKVPYKAIMRYILHYTKPGDLVFDGFCGTGMTGLAAQMCGSEDKNLEMELTEKWSGENWGARKAVLADLSPAATFISSIYNCPVDSARFRTAFQQVITKAKAECSWMYETKDECGKTYHVNYTVWSDVFICPHCGSEVVFLDNAIEETTGNVKPVFPCPNCNAELTKKGCSHAVSTKYDHYIDETIETIKQVPVLIAYQNGKEEIIRKTNQYDKALIEKIENANLLNWFPVNRMPIGGEARRNDKSGITHIHQFYTVRNLTVLSSLWNAVEQLDEIQSVKLALLSTITGIMQGVSKLQRYRANSSFPNMILSGTLYIGSMIREWNALDWVQGKFKSIAKLKDKTRTFDSSNVIISTNSLTQLPISDDSFDYIFIDPPFGGNLNYSELSFIWEAWLKIVTENDNEAIVSAEHKKHLAEYQELMTRCFCECYRVLKPNHWMTVEFHNSQNAVWNSIQESLLRSGFIIADVRTLDKKQSSFKQINSFSAVKQDLVISAYKPKASFRRDFIQKAGTKDTAWAFVQQHLDNIPVVVLVDEKIELVAERQAFLLYDRMVAYHIMSGIPVPLDATDFYRGLDERFLKRDGMYFLADQVYEYDTARIKNDVEPIQFQLFVTNEKSAIAWLYQQLETPQTYQVLQPKFMQEIKSVDKYEDMPELSVLLEENFLQNDDGKWYIPDVTKEADVAKLREKKLLKEFEGYLATKGRLKLFRAEAVRVGFAKLWADQNYKLIVDTAERLPESIIQEDDKLLMYYDISLGRV